MRLMNHTTTGNTLNGKIVQHVVAEVLKYPNLVVSKKKVEKLVLRFVNKMKNLKPNQENVTNFLAKQSNFLLENQTLIKT